MFHVYGLQTCDNVQRALRWLADEGRPCEFVDLLVRRPAIARVTRWVSAFSLRELRDGDCAAFRALPPDCEQWDVPGWIAAFTLEPRLLRGPVIERAGQPLMVGFEGTDEELRARLG